MYLLGKRADKIEDFDINRLVDNQVPESKNLDYKKELHLSRDKDKKEFLFDISAMYNTDGGCIIYGIEEIKDEKNQNTGKPAAVTGITIDNIDKLTQQIEDIIKGSTEPNITQLAIKKIIVNEKSVLIIGIPKGLGLPAMITFSGTNKFYKRRNSGKYSVDVYELNQMFMQNHVLREKANQFRNDRIKRVINQENIPNLDIETSFFIHIIPVGFLDYQILDFSTAENDLQLNMRPLYSSGWDRMYNIDGFATFSTSPDRKMVSSYNQIFRNGIYELYTSELFYETRQGVKGFNGNSFISETLKVISEGLFVLNQMQVTPPFLISFSFHNVKDKVIDSSRSFYNREFKQNQIIFPLIQIPSYESDIYKLLKPNYDILWQSLGFAKSPENK